MAPRTKTVASIFKINLQARTAALVSLAILVAMFALLPGAEAQTYTILHSFSYGPDGAYPQAGITMDAAGNLYGTAGVGGLPNHCPSGGGTVFRVTYKNSGWQFTTLYSFQSGSDGDAPTARVVFGPGGALYGTTLGGGLSKCDGMASCYPS